MNVPQTQGIKYAGSKLRLLPFIAELAERVNARTVFDGFAGTTRVGQMFARLGYRVISNDIAEWSRVFALCYFKNRRPKSFYEEIVRHLNELAPHDGWFTENYGGAAGQPVKRPWQLHNTRKLDAIRDEIDRLGLGEVEKSVLLTSLILALDAVDSTIGHHAAYLKNWSKRSCNTMRLKVPRIFESAAEHEVLSGGIFDALPKAAADLAYFDPPYGSNNERMPPSRVRYAAYYNLWTTVIRNDRPPVFGRANRRTDSRDGTAASVFEDFRKDETGAFLAVSAIEKMIREADARHVLLSYSSGGRATAEQLAGILGNCGTLIETLKVDHRRNVMASMRWTNQWTKDFDEPNREYLFLLEK
ncbi:MAG: DNA adenine methylase [Acidobacteria bacterium]|nr:DNA adenine methylase [Acidobacteriota bacterium]